MLLLVLKLRRRYVVCFVWTQVLYEQLASNWILFQLHFDTANSNNYRSHKLRMYTKFTFVQESFTNSYKMGIWYMRLRLKTNLFVSEHIHKKFSTFQWGFSFGFYHHFVKVYRSQWIVSVLEKLISLKSLFYTALPSKLEFSQNNYRSSTSQEINYSLMFN